MDLLSSHAPTAENGQVVLESALLVAAFLDDDNKADGSIPECAEEHTSTDYSESFHDESVDKQTKNLGTRGTILRGS